MLIYPYLRVIYVWDLVQGHCTKLSSLPNSLKGLLITLLLNHHPSDTHCRISGHLHRPEFPSIEPFLPQFKCPICFSFSSLTRHCKTFLLYHEVDHPLDSNVSWPIILLLFSEHPYPRFLQTEIHQSSLRPLGLARPLQRDPADTHVPFRLCTILLRFGP